jgi:SAM-dependent methyltransferase
VSGELNTVASDSVVVKTFGKQYSSGYDRLYHSKDYGRECDFIESFFKAGPVKVKTVLDLGCGTGGHAIILAKRGYAVTGVDRSEDMLTIAREKAVKAGVKIDYVRGDITRLKLNRRFDAVISMFVVMGYQTTNEALAGACRAARVHLVRNGLFLFDCWNGAAVLTQKPEARRKMLPLGNGETLLRITEPSLDTSGHTISLKIKSVRRKGRSVIDRTEERHLVRFMFPMEINYFLKTAGFGEAEIWPFLKRGKRLTENDWNMAVIARGGVK